MIEPSLPVSKATLYGFCQHGMSGLILGLLFDSECIFCLRGSSEWKIFLKNHVWYVTERRIKMVNSRIVLEVVVRTWQAPALEKTVSPINYMCVQWYRTSKKKNKKFLPRSGLQKPGRAVQFNGNLPENGGKHRKPPRSFTKSIVVVFEIKRSSFHIYSEVVVGCHKKEKSSVDEDFHWMVKIRCLIDRWRAK